MNAPGFKKFIIKPEIMPEVTWAKGYYDSVRGRIVSDWRLQGSTLTLNVEIPANTTATVCVPGKEITEGGLPVGKAEGVTFLRSEGDYSVFKVDSGTYSFKSRK